MSFSERYNQLNPEQKRAVDTIQGPVMVVAGPGSGKTELLSMRVANILQQTDTPASSILCITFTDAAAANMRQRLTGLIGQAAYDVAIHTFHSLGTTIMDRYSDFFFEGLESMPADDITSLQIMTGILEKLPKTNPFSSFHAEKGYVHARTVQNAISDIKKGGLSPEDFRRLTEDAMAFYADTQEAMAEVLDARVSKKTFDQLPAFLARLHASPYGELLPLPSMHGLKTRVMMDFHAILATNETSAISDWKKRHTERDDQKRLVWKEQKLARKYSALADIYAAYQEELHRRSLVDFNDMLIRVVEALKTHDELRYNVAEQYLYILIDEFQDTNGIQLELARLIAQVETPDMSPNILAVGDDDQAIYKFQGADVENILSFTSMFPGAVPIVLDKNYRSTPQVLALAEDVIDQCSDRLSNLMPEEYPKHLTAANPKVSGGSLRILQTPSEEEEAIFIKESVKELLAKGTPAEEIAVLGRNHKHFTLLARELRAEGIPFTYERSNNVLEDPLIMELLDMLDVVGTLFVPKYELKDDTLSRVLARPCWKIPSLTLWRLSRDAFSSYRSWLDTMLTSEDASLQQIARFFIEVGRLAAHEPVERIVDLLTGTETLLLPPVEEGGPEETFTSPLRSYYFASPRGNASEMELLAALRGLQKKIRTYLPGDVVLAKDFLAMVDLYRQYGLQISTDDTLLRKSHGLTLMTVHKSKGLEFDHVFLLRCTNDAWNGKKGGNRGVRLPKFLGLSAAPETESDFRKLFFVALTRAKRSITMTYPNRAENGKTAEVLSYLTSEVMPIHEEYTAPTALMAKDFALSPKEADPMEDGEHLDFLRDLVQDYALSITHLSSFLDVEHGGPRAFVMSHLLRFPQRKQPSGSFGTCMHTALEFLYNTLRTRGTLPTEKELLEVFTTRLHRERLSELDHTKYRDQGVHSLSTYLRERGSLLDPKAVVERNFRRDHVLIGEALITGKIDCMHIDKSSHTIQVTDWKTGTPLSHWKGKSPWDHTKLWKYRHQLMFYKLLVENSAEFRGKFVVNEGALEFLEPSQEGKIILLETGFNHSEMVDFARLVQIVSNKIHTLDFPDTSSYDPSFKGTLAFVEDLLAEKI